MSEDDARRGKTPTVGSGGEASDAEWTARRADLAERIAAQRARVDGSAAPERKQGGLQGLGEGLRLASEFVAGVLVGAGIGYLIDLALGSTPIALVIFLMLGFAAGVLNILRSVGKTPPAKG
ncbi:AtpZ/AtpI family protein [Mangrovibrevibacter kandeliae]|uniref:AtpZ/AtpI family protein n=1 Tax=Mangrovibrevibacter kandeliae TaxID=2968473 RepID=UPI00211755E1|nr:MULTISPECIES: AtpZ/AtpI family protein [unclassified Aurantimonas]MCQ8783779.1 AtpZ/AtpI family protein [Aurantimonas sp. CSK15Z-1]MCW4116501.1 AtpZ/AtpI family protein [Aurantimonas sp. MSK8Z-1]